MADENLQGSDQPDWLGHSLAQIGDLPARLNEASQKEGVAYQARFHPEPQEQELPSFNGAPIEPITPLSKVTPPSADLAAENLESGRNLSRQSFVNSFENQAHAQTWLDTLNRFASTLAGRPATPYNANPSNYRELSPSEEAERERATQSEYAGLAATIGAPEAFRLSSELARPAEEGAWHYAQSVIPPPESRRLLSAPPDLTQRELAASDSPLQIESPKSQQPLPRQPTPKPPKQPPQPIEREVDEAGFYSHALESAKALPQERGTPQQMMSILTKKMGVKQNEIDATGLNNFLADKKAVTKQELVDYLRNARFQVTPDIRYGPNAPFSQYERYSLDPRNKTYQENLLPSDAVYQPIRDQLQQVRDQLNALHLEKLPERDTPEWQDLMARNKMLAQQERKLDDALIYGLAPQGHFDAKNIIGHTMTSVNRLPGDNPVLAENKLLDVMFPSRVKSVNVNGYPEYINQHSGISFYTPEEARADEVSALRRNLAPAAVQEAVQRGVLTPEEGNLIGAARRWPGYEDPRPKVFNLDQIQSDWAKNILENTRDHYADQMFGKQFADLTKEQRTQVSATIAKASERGERPAGAYNPQKAQTLLEEHTKARAALTNMAEQTLKEMDEHGLRMPYDEWLRDKDPETIVAHRLHWLDTMHKDYLKYGDLRNNAYNDVVSKHGAWGAERNMAFQQARSEEARTWAEANNASTAAHGHPMVNTTGQWLLPTLRHSLRQAIDAGADHISIPSGPTVLSYNPGQEYGMGEFYDKIVPNTLSKILKSYDKQYPGPQRVDKLVTPSLGERGQGFTIFPLTDAVKQAVAKGQPMFAAGGAIMEHEDLPEHERNHLDNRDEAWERAKHIIPYMRAGGEAHKRGEDFFGGTEQYDRQLRALNEFYGLNPSAPIAQTAPIAPEAQPARKHGGAINSIHDTFTGKLQDKERMISSLEKAIARKPNTKLSKRIAKEKSEVERIREHLTKINAHV